MQCRPVRTTEGADYDMTKFWTKTISTQKYRQRSGIDQLLSIFATFLFFDYDPHVITVHPPIPAHIFCLLIQYDVLAIYINEQYLE